MIRVSLRAALVAAAFLVSLSARAENVLTVEAVMGHASVERLGERSDLKPGDQLAERDLIRVSADGRMSLRFSHNGFAELGPESVLAVEKLPFASYATDLKSIFTLTQGYLRIVWKHPEESPTSWPLFVFFGGQRAALSTGEFFFDSRPGSARVCVAAGQVSAIPINGAASQTLRAPACYRLAAGRAPETTQADPERWISVRSSFSLDAPSSPEARLAAADSPSTLTTGSNVETPVAEESALPAPATSLSPSKARMTPSLSKAATVTTPVSAPVLPGATQEATPAAATLGSTGSGDWVINIASYPDASTASAQVEQLRVAGYAVVVREANVKGRNWYRVQLPNFASPEAARAKADEVQTRLGFKNLWIVHAQ